MEGQIQKTDEESKINFSADEDHEIQPTLQDWKTLPRVADKLPTSKRNLFKINLIN